MTSKTSYSSFPRRVREGCRRYIWVTILSFIGFLLGIILPVVLESSHYHWMLETANLNDDKYSLLLSQNRILEYLSFNNPFVAVVLIVLAIVGGMGVFSYLHGSKETDLFHSLPVTRQKLFITDYCIVPLIVIFSYLAVNLLGIITAVGLSFGEVLSAPLILFGMLQSIVFFLLVYSVAVLGTILCGNRIVSALFLLWLYFSPSVWMVLLDAYFQTLRTYVSQMWIQQLAVKLSPIIYFFYRQQTEDNLMYTLRNIWKDNAAEPADWAGQLIKASCPALFGCFLAFLLISALCFLLFTWRRSEAAGNALAFETIKLPVKVYMTVMVALAGGLFLKAIAGDSGSYAWMIAGILIAAFLMHGVVEAIYRQDVRGMFKKLPHFAVCAALAVLIALFIRLDVMGYDTKRPDLSKISSANLYCYNINSSHTETRDYESDFSAERDIFTEPAELEKMWRMASACVDVLERETEPDYEQSEDLLMCRVVFHTASGSTMVRQYNVNSVEAREIAKELTHTPEYIDAYHVLGRHRMDEVLLDANGQMPARLHLSGGPYINSSEDHEFNADSAESALAIWEAAREEYRKADVADLESQLPVCYIQLNDMGEAAVYDSYKKTMQLIGEHSDYSRYTIDPAEVDCITLVFTPSGRGFLPTFYTPQDPEYEEYNRASVTGSPRQVTVYDPDDIALLLRTACSGRAIGASEYSRAGSLWNEAEMTVRLQNGERIYNLTWFSDDAPRALLESYLQQAAADEDAELYLPKAVPDY